MPERDTGPATPAGGEAVSKSARKRAMTARQALGERLCALSPADIDRLPLEDGPLRDALLAARHVTSRSAGRRHRQYIGKLMRGIDPAPLAAALADLHRARAAESAALHETEALRDRLLAEGDDALPAVLTRFPAADRQHLRQLLRRARREAGAGAPPAAARRLFRYLRDLRSGP